MAAKKPATLKRQAREIAKELPKLIPQPNGRGALLSGGIPGHKGGTGRPPNAFKHFLAELRDNPNVRQAIEQAAEGKRTPGEFKAALDILVKYDPETPAERHLHDHSHTISDEERESRVVEIVMLAKDRKQRGLTS